MCDIVPYRSNNLKYKNNGWPNTEATSLYAALMFLPYLMHNDL